MRVLADGRVWLSMRDASAVVNSIWSRDADRFLILNK
jgi:hypothetical protein